MYIARIAALVLIAAACGTTQTDGDGGADGGGVCCPLVGPPPGCDCVSVGGWAESVEKCSNKFVCDGWKESTDSHGCDIAVPDPSKFSQCPPMPKDSGANDASTKDVTSE